MALTIYDTDGFRDGRVEPMVVACHGYHSVANTNQKEEQ